MPYVKDMNFQKNSKWKWKLIFYLISKVKLSKIYSIIKFKMFDAWSPIWCLATSLPICSLIIVHQLDGWKMDGWKNPIMNEKSSTWMKTRKKNNDVAGLNWCWTWPLAESIHEALKLSKCPNLWVWKNEKKIKIKRRSKNGSDWIALSPLIPKLLLSSRT